MILIRMIDVLGQPYILAARARGLTRNQVVLRHAVRNALPTFANIGGLQIGYLFGGVIFSEIIFNWPGIGLLLFEAILQRDVPVIQGCVLAVAVVFVLGNMSMRRLAVAGDNLILVKDAQGAFTCFHNTCRHRGAELCATPEKRLKSKLISCPYHELAQLPALPGHIRRGGIFKGETQDSRCQNLGLGRLCGSCRSA